MIVRVKVGDHFYEVELSDLSTSPVIAMVDGIRFEVYPERSAEEQPSGEKPALPAESLGPEDSLVSKVLAPMPGSITSVSAKPGQQVARGEELCILEAMKMKNSIRSPRSGVIERVHVSPGQQVKFHDLLIEFQE